MIQQHKELKLDVMKLSQQNCFQSTDVTNFLQQIVCYLTEMWLQGDQEWELNISRYSRRDNKEKEMG